ncbi:MAG: anion transporter [Anaerolineales bacterium]|nr:anion transporter [Anaerolineales bacterium]
MTFWLTTLIVTFTYIGIAIGGFPGLRVNRTTITLIGVGLLLGLGLLDFEKMGSLLEINTLVLLFGMMVINANLQLAGFFRLAGAFILRFTRSPRTLLALEILAAGVLSALFLNDTICIMLTPLIVDVTLSAKRNPIPYLIALAAAANIGSVATLTGNPQNMIIGIASGISYLGFAAALTPIALLGLGSIWLVLVLFYREEFAAAHFEHVEIPEPRLFRPLLYKSLFVTAGLLIAFVLGVPIAEAAFVAGCVLLFTRRVHPEKVMNEVDWNLLVFFAALFILTGVIELNGLTEGLFAFLSPYLNRGATTLAAITVLLSNLVSNVPAVLLLRPAVAALANPQAGWLTLAAASTLAGNLTLLGSVANLIVAESAAKRGIALTFWEYTRSGLVITLLSLVIGVVWIQIFIWK